MAFVRRIIHAVVRGRNVKKGKIRRHDCTGEYNIKEDIKDI